jgi:hypothetical protein
MMTRRLAFLALTSLAAACSGGEDFEAGNEDLTSVTARTRELHFAGYVYVTPTASSYDILAAVKHQTQSAFGALRTSKIGVETRELSAVDAKTFVKTTVKVVDPTKPTDPGHSMVRVDYQYTDTALVPVTMATRSSISIGVLNGNYESQGSRVMTECTANDAEAKEFSSDLWYVFEPSLPRCTNAMATEQKKIDADRAKLAQGVVPASEISRLYIPLTAALKTKATTSGTTYPEYDRLYAGGVQPGKLVVGMVSGLMADWAAGEVHATADDPGYDMWFEGLDEIFKVRAFKLASIEPKEDLTTFTVGTQTVKMPGGFTDIMKMELDGVYPTGVSYTNQKALRDAAAKKLLKHWLVFDAPVTVKIGSGTTKPFTIELQTYFGAEEDPTPHKRAIKTSDVFVYNGHSYIGYGPLDPSNFTTSDFPKTYQLLVVNGCISFNYYDHYFGLKSGGTANLDTITNGLERPARRLGRRRQAEQLLDHPQGLRVRLPSLRLGQGRPPRGRWRIGQHLPQDEDADRRHREVVTRPATCRRRPIASRHARRSSRELRRSAGRRGRTRARGSSPSRAGSSKGASRASGSARAPSRFRPSPRSSPR